MLTEDLSTDTTLVSNARIIVFTAFYPLTVMQSLRISRLSFVRCSMFSLALLMISKIIKEEMVTMERGVVINSGRIFVIGFGACLVIPK